MLHLTPRIGRAITAAMILGAVAFVVPSAALADASPATATRAHDPVEAHIKSLRASLQITAAQDPQWQAVAQAMRDNANAMRALIKDRAAKAKTMTAIDDLQSYAAIADAHAAGVKALIPPFQALYDTMSDAQKKIADAVFQHRPRHPHMKSSG